MSCRQYEDLMVVKVQLHDRRTLSASLEKWVPCDRTSERLLSKECIPSPDGIGVPYVILLTMWYSDECCNSERKACLTMGGD